MEWDWQHWVALAVWTWVWDKWVSHHLHTYGMALQVVIKMNSFWEGFLYGFLSILLFILIEVPKWNCHYFWW